MIPRILGAILALLVPAGQALAQGDCFPPKNSNEAKTLAIFSVPLAYAPAGLVGWTDRRVQFGLELSYLPNVGRETATPTVCRPGKGPENTDLLFAAPRPRLAIRLGGGFSFEGSWTPPVRVSGVRANLVAGALSYDTRLGSKSGLALRAHGSFGTIKAPITCPDKELSNGNSECYQGTRSDDSYRPNIVGVDATVHWRVGNGSVHPYLGAGYNRLMPRFQVNFRNVQNQLDNRKVEVDLDRLAVFGGMAWSVAAGWNLAAELYSTPSDAVTGRVAIRVGL